MSLDYKHKYLKYKNKYMLVKELSGGAELVIEKSLIEPVKQLMIDINEIFNNQGIISNIEDVINNENKELSFNFRNNDTTNYSSRTYLLQHNQINVRLQHYIKNIYNIIQIINKPEFKNKYILNTISQNNNMLEKLFTFAEYNLNNIKKYVNLLDIIKNILSDTNNNLYSIYQNYYSLLIDITNEMFIKLKILGLYDDKNDESYIHIIALYIIVNNFINIIKNFKKTKSENYNKSFFQYILYTLDNLITKIEENKEIKINTNFNLELINLIKIIQNEQIIFLSYTKNDILSIRKQTTDFDHEKTYTIQNINEYLDEYNFLNKIKKEFGFRINSMIRLNTNTNINDIIKKYDSIIDIPYASTILKYIYENIIGEQNIILLTDLSKKKETGYDKLINNELATKINIFLNKNKFKSTNNNIDNIYNNINQIMDYTLVSNMRNINIKQTLLSMITNFNIDITNIENYNLGINYITKIVETYYNYKISEAKQKIINTQDFDLNNILDTIININNNESVIIHINKLNEVKYKITNTQTKYITGEKQTSDDIINIRNKFSDLKNSNTEILVNNEKTGGADKFVSNDNFNTFIIDLYKKLLKKKVTILVNLIKVIYKQSVNNLSLNNLSTQDYFNYYFALSGSGLKNQKYFENTFLHLYRNDILCEILMLIPIVTNISIQEQIINVENTAYNKALKEADAKAAKADAKADVKADAKAAPANASEQDNVSYTTRIKNKFK